MKTSSLIKRLWQLIKENTSFLAVLIATFLSLIMIVGLAFGSFYESSRENAVTIGDMTVAYEAQRIEDALYSGINTLLVSSYTVDSMLNKGATPQEVEEYMVRETDGIISGINPDFSGIYGVIKDEYVDGIGWQPEAGYDPYARPWYIAAAQKQGELAIVSPYIDAQTNTIMLSFSKILSDSKSAISLDIQLNNIYDVTRTIQLNGKGYCFLIDRKGQIIAHRDDSQVGKNYITDAEFDNSDIRTLMKRTSAAAESQTFEDVLVDGEECMVFTHSVRGEWIVVLVVRSADLFEGIRAGLARSILVSIAIFILVGYFCTSNYLNKKRALRYAEDIRTDDLTGLNNRGEFDRYLNAATSSVSPEKQLYLLIFDADDFKGINDRFGHQEGDRALRLIAKALMSECHGTDWFCARYGGDEFVIICRCSDDACVKKVITNMNERLTALVAENELPYTLSMSCGYACFDPSTQSLSDLVIAADQELYQRKAERKRGWMAQDGVADE